MSFIKEALAVNAVFWGKVLGGKSNIGLETGSESFKTEESFLLNFSSLARFLDGSEGGKSGKLQRAGSPEHLFNRQWDNKEATCFEAPSVKWTMHLHNRLAHD